MKIIAISGSPRAKGNTATLLAEAANACREEGVVADVLFLTELDIQQCDGCLFCEETACSGQCAIQDDMTKVVVPKLMTSDAVIFGTPSYFDLPTGLLKVFMDRTNLILGELTKKQMLCGTIVVGQSTIESLTAAAQAVDRYCSICGMRSVDNACVKVLARDIGDVQKDPEALHAARALGRSMARALLAR